MCHRLFVASGVLCLSLFACSGADQRGDVGSGAPLDCSFQACGGELVGEWQISEGCVADPNAEALEGCPDSRVVFDAKLGGTLSFAADGSYSWATTLGGTRSYSVPSACSGGASCDAVGQSITASCAATAASCECSSVVEDSSSSAAGTYSTSDGELALTPSDGEAEVAQSEYCVSGDALRLRITDARGKTTLFVAKR